MKHTLSVFKDDIIQEFLKKGDHVLVYSKENLRSGKITLGCSKDMAKRGGFPGNSNSNIRCYHGWRGTTNDIYVYAHGVYSVRSVKNIDGETVSVVLNRTDLVREED